MELRCVLKGLRTVVFPIVDYVNERTYVFSGRGCYAMRNPVLQCAECCGVLDLGSRVSYTFWTFLPVSIHDMRENGQRYATDDFIMHLINCTCLRPLRCFLFRMEGYLCIPTSSTRNVRLSVSFYFSYDLRSAFCFFLLNHFSREAEKPIIFIYNTCGTDRANLLRRV